MGKLNIDLLKGVEEQQEVINKSKTNDKPQSLQKAESSSPKTQTVETTSEEKNIQFQTNTKPKKQTFSFRAEVQKVENWKLYSETIGIDDIGSLWTVAIDEYIENHKLTAEQQAVYDLKKQALEAQKKIIRK